MSLPNAAKQLRSLIEESTIQVPGAPSALAAKLIEQNGFDAIYLSGAVLSTNVFALPDVGLFTLTELVTHASYLTKAVDLPVIVDADTGFGEAINVQRTIEELEAIGVAAIQLEDQQLPKRCGHLSGKTLVTTDEMCHKIRAATSAKSNNDTIIIARTDAAAVENVNQAIARAKAYLDAGADWIFPEALTTIDEFELFSRSIDAPLMANMTEFGKSPLLTLQELADLGYAVVLYPVSLMRIAMKAMEAALIIIGDEGTQQEIIDLMQTRQELYDLIDYQSYEKQDQQFFGDQEN